jgi:hypothetical protein
MPRSNRPTTSAQIEPGAKVRVKHGVRDPDFPDIPLGGWAGTVQEVHRAEGEVTYLIAWDRRTLRDIHPIYRKRCERDGLDFETMALGEPDIEPDDGERVPIEEPTEINTPPLSEKDQDDRVRLALGLTHDDPLPEANRKTLLAYHRYLTAHLTFPFKARHEVHGTPLMVLRLLSPKEYDLEEGFGLLCEARDRTGPSDMPLADLEGAGPGNRRLIQDYGYWFHNYA